MLFFQPGPWFRGYDTRARDQDHSGRARAEGAWSESCPSQAVAAAVKPQSSGSTPLIMHVAMSRFGRNLALRLFGVCALQWGVPRLRKPARCSQWSPPATDDSQAPGRTVLIGWSGRAPAKESETAFWCAVPLDLHPPPIICWLLCWARSLGKSPGCNIAVSRCCLHACQCLRCACCSQFVTTSIIYAQLVFHPDLGGISVAAAYILRLNFQVLCLGLSDVTHSSASLFTLSPLDL